MIAKRDSCTLTHTHTHSMHTGVARARQRKLFKESGKQTKAKTKQKSVQTKKMWSKHNRRQHQASTKSESVFVQRAVAAAAAAALKRYFFLFTFHLLQIGFSFAVCIVFIQPAWKINNLRTKHTQRHTHWWLYLFKSIGLFWWKLRPGIKKPTTTASSSSYRAYAVFIFSIVGFFYQFHLSWFAWRFFHTIFFSFCKHINGHFMVVNTTYTSPTWGIGIES